MARMIPDVRTKIAENSERKTHEALSKLDGSWTVLHSVAWQSLRHGRPADGEADFVLLHPRRGIVVLEVKGGGIDVRAGQWTTTDRKGRLHQIKDPFRQAQDSKYALLRHLRSVEEVVPPVCHGVVLPDIVCERELGPGAPRELIVDARDMANVDEAIERIVRHWENRCDVSISLIDRLVSHLAPTVREVPSLRYELKGLGDRQEQSSQKTIMLTDEQLEVLGQLRRTRRAIVYGPAGSGKTLLSVQRARRLAAEGGSVLITCYNAPLAHFLSRRMPEEPHVEVSTFHSLCVRRIRSAGLPVPAQPSDSWWISDAPNLLVEAAGRDGSKFDAVIVDEGQDFHRDWLEALDLLCASPGESPFYIFADTQQALYTAAGGLPEWPTDVLKTNLRNTAPIARKVAAIYGDAALTNELRGPPPRFVSADIVREGASTIQHLVDRLMREEALDASQIAVLTTSRRLVSDLRDKLVGEHGFCGLGGHGVVAETVKRFKGLEADVVVLAIADDVLRDEHEARALAYVGMSRARLLLFVLGGPRVRRALNWDT